MHAGWPSFPTVATLQDWQGEEKTSKETAAGSKIGMSRAGTMSQVQRGSRVESPRCLAVGKTMSS